MIRIIDSLPEHADLIAPKAIFLDNPGLVEQTKYGIKTSYAITMLSPKGEVMAIIGRHMLFPHVAEFWAVTSSICEEYPVEFHKKTLAMLDGYTKMEKVVRAQMAVRTSYVQGLRWASALGFRYEGTMKKYGPEGADYAMMGRT